MSYSIGLLREEELAAFRAFCGEHWGSEHPLIHNEAMFDYYYRRGERINFMRARDDETGDILSVCGFLFANESTTPDVFLSYILSKPGAPLSVGLALVEEIRRTTGCRVCSCNNVRKKVKGFYGFLGFDFVQMTQFYRLNTDLQKYTLCNIKRYKQLPVERKAATFRRIETERGLDSFDFEAYADLSPYKDRQYAAHRYFRNPWLGYEVYAVGEGEGDEGLLVLRDIEHEGHRVLRVVDFIGRRDLIPACGGHLDALLRQRGAEFCDWYCWGIGEEVMAAAGFQPRAPKDENILPNYLSPPLMENVDFYIVTDRSEGFAMFKADGDQDRPNLG